MRARGVKAAVRGTVLTGRCGDRAGWSDGAAAAYQGDGIHADPGRRLLLRPLLPGSGQPAARDKVSHTMPQQTALTTHQLPSLHFLHISSSSNVSPPLIPSTPPT